MVCLACCALALAGEPSVDEAVLYREDIVHRRDAAAGHLALFTSTIDLANVDQPASLARARATLTGDMDAAGELEPWQGDASLVEALLRFGEELLVLVDGPFTQLLPILDPPTPFGARRRAERRVELLLHVHDEMRAALERFDGVVAVFTERWIEGEE